MHQPLLEADQWSIAVRLLGGDQAAEGSVTRLLCNDKVRIEDRIAHAREQTKRHVSILPILAIQNPTSLRYGGIDHSLNPHPTLAVGAEAGTVLGLVHTELLKHESGRKASRGKRAIQDKESRRWLTGNEVADGLVAAGSVLWRTAKGISSGASSSGCSQIAFTV